MRFNRTLKGHMPTPYPKGYQAPTTALFNVDKIELTLGTTTKQTLKPWNECLPKYLALKVSVIPEAIAGRDVTATLITDHGPTEPLPIYEEAEALQDLCFVYTGSGTCYERQGEEIKDLERLLAQHNLHLKGERWHYPFHFQEQSVVHQQAKGEQSVWAYGGEYHPGTPWQEVAQSFFTLSEEGRQVNLKKIPLSAWHENGLTPPLTDEYGGRQVTFVGAQASTPYTNLYDHIVQGGFTLTLHPELGDVYQQYRSEEIKRLSADQAIMMFVRTTSSLRT